MHFILAHWKSWAYSVAILAGSILAALAARWLLFALLDGLAKEAPSLLKDSLIHHSRRLARWIFPLLAIVIALPEARFAESVMRPLQHVVGLALIASFAWLAVLVSDVAFDVLGSHYRTDVRDNLLARKVQTQLRVLRRIVAVIVVIVTASVMLMTFPAIRQIGTSLLASAGLAGLIVGMAMRPTLSSLIAGMQIALTQPIRIDDVVVVEGEWGWIEEIQTTFVVVRIWDLRRLVLPLSYFIEHPFENWTHTSADLLAYVVLWLDYTVPVDELRGELTRILKSTDKWKGEVNVLQVTDANDRAIQIRALMDAADSSIAWDLRCYVRENLIGFLQLRYPQCLPRCRAEFSNESPRTVPAGGRALTPAPHSA
ncbi:MAG TPA: mechanosensitive ion channel domain-containing protein [Candidatus Acidoferrum sp.]|nr:mechanosensitive ion channel domain-containing protein [Candidatus Acidoferrum sp.]